MAILVALDHPIHAHLTVRIDSNFGSGILTESNGRLRSLSCLVSQAGDISPYYKRRLRTPHFLRQIVEDAVIFLIKALWADDDLVMRPGLFSIGDGADPLDKALIVICLGAGSVGEGTLSVHEGVPSLLRQVVRAVAKQLDYISTLCPQVPLPRVYRGLD